MPQRRLTLMDIRELLLHIRSGSSDRQIQRDTGVGRRTVQRYRRWAEEQGLLEGPLPPTEALQALIAQTVPERTPPQNVSSVEPYRELVIKWRKEQVEMSAIHDRLRERGFSGSYMAVNRFVHSLEPIIPKATVRVERKPGEEAQIDFGYTGYMMDPQTGRLRKTWAFVMTLSWSRHQYAEFVFDQKVETWIRLHSHAFEFFQGVPQRVVIDNLKAAIIRACWNDPQVQYSYRECAEHCGFLIAPCRPRTPEHKGKVEQGGVHYVKRNFLGGRDATTITQANRDVRGWCLTTAGLRIHGTTKEKPLERFQQAEQACLKPLPPTPYDMAVWKRLKVKRDCYIEFDQAYYSVPFRLIEQRVWVCGGSRQVRIFNQKYELEATHERAQKPGERCTQLNHLPPEKVPGLVLARDSCLAEAALIGPATQEVVQAMLEDPVLDRLPTVGRLIRLRHRYDDRRLEAACRRALEYGDPNYGTIKGILAQKLDQPELVVTSSVMTFARSNEELVGELAGATPWN